MSKCKCFCHTPEYFQSLIRPMLIVKVGSDAPGAPEVTTQQFKTIVEAFTTQQKNGGNVYVRGGYLIKDVQVVPTPTHKCQCEL